MFIMFNVNNFREIPVLEDVSVYRTTKALSRLMYKTHEKNASVRCFRCAFEFVLV